MAFSHSRIGIVLLTAIDDGGWGTAGYAGLKAICEQTNAELLVRDRIPLDRARQAFAGLCEQGCTLIFGHGSELSPVIQQAAAENPQVMFACVNGTSFASNLAALEMKDEEIGYLAGVLAGCLSSSKKVGFIGALEIPATLRLDHGFREGALQKGAEVISTYTGDFYDRAKAQNAAETLIGRGVDVFYCYLNSAWEGVREACRQANCRMIEPILERPTQNPAVVASAVQNAGALYTQAVLLFDRDELRGRRYRVGVEDPTVERLVLHSIPPEIAAEIEATRVRILNREVDIQTKPE